MLAESEGPGAREEIHRLGTEATALYHQVVGVLAEQVEAGAGQGGIAGLWTSSAGPA
ncbi:hypothetical protein [Streptomyces toxytricini]|uniref:hypothetical protein n=1 Tax=Streptomyces toxytricini TaxID=67369 RepID=UPI00344531A3